MVKMVVRSYESYKEYPHHIENMENGGRYPDWFFIRLTLKERLKKMFGLYNPLKFECWVRDRNGIEWKCLIFERSYMKILGVRK